MARFYPGWPLTELKNLPARERRYWLDLTKAMTTG